MAKYDPVIPHEHLEVVPRHTLWKIGEYVTFIENECILGDDHQPLAVGQYFTRLYDTRTGPKLFKIEEIVHESVYWTKYIGYAIIGSDMRSKIVDDDGNEIHV